VLLLETDYSMYIIFYMQNIKNGTKTQVLALYGNPTLSVWESQPLGGHLPWALDILWNGALGLLPNKKSQICPQGAPYCLTRLIRENLKTSAIYMGWTHKISST
jgi:hypothetical protein